MNKIKQHSTSKKDRKYGFLYLIKKTCTKERNTHYNISSGTLEALIYMLELSMVIRNYCLITYFLPGRGHCQRGKLIIWKEISLSKLKDTIILKNDVTVHREKSTCVTRTECLPWVNYYIQKLIC